MMKNLRMLVGLAGGVALLSTGCGAESQEELATGSEPQPTPEQPRFHQQSVYTVCWSELGIYSQPNTSSMVVFPLKYGNHFNTDSSVFSSNGENWVRGQLYCYAPYTCTGGYGYVRWAGLC